MNTDEIMNPPGSAQQRVAADKIEALEERSRE